MDKFTPEQLEQIRDAAPELLKALIALRNEFFPSANSDDYPEWADARAAIAKATLNPPRGQDMDILSAEAKEGKLWL